jgi:hypothetical protein
MTVPSKTSIADRLYQAAEARTWYLGLVFTPNASSRMKSMAEHGAEKILERAQKKTTEEGERYVRVVTRVGSQAMVVFVDEMGELRLITPDYIKKHGNELDEDIWTKVRDLLCPLWPIC